MSNATRILVTGVLCTQLFNPFFLYHLLKGFILSIRKLIRKVILKETNITCYREYFQCGILSVNKFMIMQDLFLLFGCAIAMIDCLFTLTPLKSHPYLPIIIYMVNMVISESYVSPKNVMAYKWVSLLYCLIIIYPLSIFG